MTSQISATESVNGEIPEHEKELTELLARVLAGPMEPLRSLLGKHDERLAEIQTSVHSLAKDLPAEVGNDIEELGERLKSASSSIERLLVGRFDELVKRQDQHLAEAAEQVRRDSQISAEQQRVLQESIQGLQRRVAWLALLVGVVMVAFAVVVSGYLPN